MAGPSAKQKNLLGHLWGLFCSRKLAVLLFLLVLALLLLSLRLPQEPAELDAAGLVQWRTALEARYGDRLDFYESLGLTHLYRTPLFVALVGALFLNALCCTLDRLGRLWRALTRRPALSLPDSSYVQYNAPPPDLSPELLRHALRRRRYRLREEQAGGTHYFYGERFRLAPLGTVLTHLGLSFLVLAVLLHVALGWHKSLWLDPPIPTIQWVPAYDDSAPLALRRQPCFLINVGADVSTERTAFKGLRGDLMFGEDENWDRGWVGPSAPLSACGLGVYLNSYGLILLVEAFDPNDQPLEIVSSDGDSGLLHFPEGIAEGSFNIPAREWHVTITPSSRAHVGFSHDPLGLRVDRAGQTRPLFEGQVDPMEPLLLDGVRLEFTPGVFFLVELVHDPGLPWFIAAGLCLSAGSALTLLFPHRRLWARLTPEGQLYVRFGGRAEQEGSALAEALDAARGGAL